MKTKATYFVVFLILSSLLVVTCSKYINVSYGDNGITADVKNITIGTLKEVATGSIGTSGGTITVSGSGTKIDGLTITVPDSAFGSAQTITVSVADISGHQLGDNFKPISPLINIDCPGGYAKGLMSLTIPVTIPAGSIPVGFFLDAETGKLEGIPFESITSNSITLLTRHFLSGNNARGNPTGLKNGMIATPSGANIIISSMSESLLQNKAIISTGFKPGVDDWEFVNRGSYISSGGHCAGQSITAMWYYFEKKPTEGNLFNKFSDNANLWQDNARGYRFCSVIQEDLGPSSFMNGILRNYIRFNSDLDKLKFNTIAGIMLVTGEPCYISIALEVGKDAKGNPIYGGHALVCYQIAPSEGKLYISDPNTPATEQTIQLANDKFSPYIAKFNGDEDPLPFPFISFLAKSAMIEWNQIGKRYEELLDGSIGTVGTNQFPAYTITATNDGNKELKDGYVTGKDTLHFMVFCPAAEIYYAVDGKKVTGMEVFDKSGRQIDTQDGINGNSVDLNSSSYITLKPGLNTIGCLIYGWRRDVKFDNGIFINKYLDFKWYTVKCVPLEIKPNPLLGKMLTDYIFIARTQGYAPANAKYVWDFGDGSTEVVKVNDSTVVHKFPEDADYEIMVTLYDNATNQKICDAYSTAEIKSEMLSELQKFRLVGFSLRADFKYSDPGKTPVSIGFGNVVNGAYGDDDSELHWDGTKFTANFYYYYDGVFLGIDSTRASLSGEMSEDGMTIKSLSGRHYSQFEGTDKETIFLSIENIPLDTAWKKHDTQPRFAITGTDVSGHVRGVSYQFVWHEYMSDKWKTSTLEEVIYTNPAKVPVLQVEFAKKRE